MELQYIRKGSCNRCGNCCKLLPLWNNLPEEIKAFMRMFDKNSELILNRKHEHRCPNLVIQKNGLTHCKIYNSKEKPRFCSLYPATLEDLVEGCSYYFEIKHKTIIAML